MTNRYAVKTDAREGVTIYTLVENGAAQAEIVPAWGDNCFSFRAPDEVMELVSFEQFRLKPTSYGVPILFPFPNRIRDGKFTFRGETFEVDPKIHGFVRDKAWTVENTGASDEDGAWLHASFEAASVGDRILKQFPFPFRLEVVHRLKNGVLRMETVVKNTGTRDMPFGFGIHPYFRKPTSGAIRVPANARWDLVENLPTGNRSPVEESVDLRAGAALDTLILDDVFTDLTPDADGLVRCVITDAVNQRETVIAFLPEIFPNAVVFTPPPGRESVCIEPQTCPTDAFNLHERGVASNMIVLPPGGSAAFWISIYSRKCD
jgi:aldose 1-epimerase